MPENQEMPQLNALGTVLQCRFLSRVGGGHFPSPDFNQDFASPDEILEILLGPHKFAKVCLSHCKMDKTINQQRLQMCLFSLHVNINEFDMNSDRSTIAASPGWYRVNLFDLKTDNGQTRWTCSISSCVCNKVIPELVTKINITHIQKYTLTLKIGPLGRTFGGSCNELFWGPLRPVSPCHTHTLWMNTHCA